MNGTGSLAMRFSILDIWADGYERIAHIRSINSESEFFVSFIEHDEYIDPGKSSKRAAGTEIEGNLQMSLSMIFQVLMKDRFIVKTSLNRHLSMLWSM